MVSGNCLVFLSVFSPQASAAEGRECFMVALLYSSVSVGNVVDGGIVLWQVEMDGGLLGIGCVVGS